MPTIVDNDRLMIRHRPGTSGRAVVSFAGIGLGLGGAGNGLDATTPPGEEFVRTFSSSDDDQYFVVDKQRSWYNATAGEIIDRLSPHLVQQDKCITLGNSMGGFGAVYFGARLPGCKAAVAFGPQYSVHPEIASRDRRWQQFRSKITDWTIPHALISASPELRYFLFFGERSDRYQARMFQKNIPPQSATYILANERHNTAAVLSKRGLLLPVIEATWNDAGFALVQSILQDAGVATLDPASLLRRAWPRDDDESDDD